jgi:lysophospholipase L1-like esterase
VLVTALLGAGAWLGIELVSKPPAAYTAGQQISDPGTVAVVGDSITELSKDSIATSLTHAGYHPIVHAVIGIEMAQALPWIDQLAQQNPRNWIIELGTNDAGKNNPSWVLPFLAIWQQVRSSACVIYLSVSQRAGPIATQIDASLAGLALTHANVHVLDWGNLEYLNPAWMEPDMIHPTPAGQAELAALETQELRRSC